MMDALEITYLLRRAGKTQRQVALDLGVATGVVNNVIHDRITAYGVASHIAQLIGKEVEELWPDRYRFKPRRTRRDIADQKPL
jgi:lambda repressor-like predicted transcriptional regulator